MSSSSTKETNLGAGGDERVVSALAVDGVGPVLAQFHLGLVDSTADGVQDQRSVELGGEVLVDLVAQDGRRDLVACAVPGERVEGSEFLLGLALLRVRLDLGELVRRVRLGSYGRLAGALAFGLGYLVHDGRK